MFITFEGIDFCGKSTQVELLARHLRGKGKEVSIIREPGGTEISEKIRDILLDKKHYNMCIESEIFLFSASRSQLVREVIKPSLNKGVYVISDRFHDSSTAYQSFGRGIPLDDVVHINRLAIDNCIPDITFFIDIPLEEADKRKKLRHGQELDRIEISDHIFFEKVRNGYLHLVETENRFRHINGARQIEEIHNEIISEIDILEKSVKI